MEPPADMTAPNSVLDEAVRMNSLLDIAGILASLNNFGFNLRLPDG
jgi:hypothetical protein